VHGREREMKQNGTERAKSREEVNVLSRNTACLGQRFFIMSYALPSILMIKISIKHSN
jgi:hypothetical protein